MTDKHKKRIGRLDTIGGLVSEMAKVYREARRNELEIEKATKLVYMLNAMRAGMEANVLEERVRQLEEQKNG